MDLTPPPQLSQLLSYGGYSTAQVQQAVAGYTGIDVGAQNAILGLVSNGPSVGTIAPLIAAGFAATGVGAPIAAAIAVGLPIVEGIASLLSGDQDCAWHIGKICVGSNTKRPYDPSDPTWLTFEYFGQTVERVMPGSFSPDGIIRDLPHRFVERDAAIPGLDSTVNEFFAVDAAKRYALRPANPRATPLEQFRRAFAIVWSKNAEWTINGHNAIDAYTLLTSMVRTWNATHADTSTVQVYGNESGTMIERLLGGSYDGQRHPPITLSTGAVIKPPKRVVKISLKGVRLQGPPPAPSVTVNYSPNASSTVAVGGMAIHLPGIDAPTIAGPKPTAATKAPTSAKVVLGLGAGGLALAALAAKLLLL